MSAVVKYEYECSFRHIPDERAAIRRRMKKNLRGFFTPTRGAVRNGDEMIVLRVDVYSGYCASKLCQMKRKKIHKNKQEFVSTVEPAPYIYTFPHCSPAIYVNYVYILPFAGVMSLSSCY